ncbi:DUF3418 domain-containing protein [Actinomyces sp. oral taxon 181]|uniref:DUF3418 domain-containing protein n=1 Tax=Actinomyces sp. oral taxon 181 TaxID=712121 RepID=UPI00344E40B4
MSTSSQPRRRRAHSRRGRSPHASAPFRPFTPEQLAARAAAIPLISFPDLPVSARRDEIAQAISQHQVVIISGETGSGKTTQIPKICLHLGRGVGGMIGHTQPRRIAARSVAERIAAELGQKVGKEPGEVVGYQVRFTDEVGPTTLVKLMTDGILLAEIQSDPMLRRYDTLIIDEAHERSLNIDFILGYLARLLPLRPDLKVIITSATIDSDRFARHFGRWNGPIGQGTLIEAAPVIEVSGRTFPVEIRYRPLAADTPASYSSSSTSPDAQPAESSPATASAIEEESTGSGVEQLVLEDPDDPLALEGYGAGQDIDVETAICHAVDELCSEGPGDILVFLPGERDIRDTEQALRDHLGNRAPRDISHSKSPADIEILPLFARLSSAEQHRIFEEHSHRRIVLATNVAETSLTVPGIRYVIDPGMARISRYSNKTKVQRLPIEEISKASANQRSGRCGRVADGIAIRLYSADNFASRPDFTEPEILRTSLASVILQMSALGLGDVASFPFVDAPDSRAIRDGINQLIEIGALRPLDSSKNSDSSALAQGNQGLELTRIGRDLARLPIDPHLGRMLIAGHESGCASEILVIVAALSIQDVRERPLEHQEAADTAHARFADSHSDFLTYLNLWRYLHVQQRDLSGSAFRRMCRAEFIHYLRFREWRDIAHQLRDMARSIGINTEPLGMPSAGDVVEQASRTGIADAAAKAAVAFTRSTSAVDTDDIHRSILVGLLSSLGAWDPATRDYTGSRGTHFTIWPGSGITGHPDWVMTAELVETSRLFARTVARIRPEWVEPLAKDLLNHVYSEPTWNSSRGAAYVQEKVMLYGLTLIADRSVLLGRLGSTPLGSIRGAVPTDSPFAIAQQSPITAAELAREMFIRHALVQGQWRERHAFQRRNDEAIERARETERRSRTHGLVADEMALERFFDDLLPASIISAGHFNRWWKNEKRQNPHLLDYPPELLLPRGLGQTGEGFPNHWQQGELRLPLSYEFHPGSPRDGVSMSIPVEALGRVSDEGTDWLVPGMREELITEAIRALPKAKRRLLAPAPEVAKSLATWIDDFRDGRVSAHKEPDHAHSGESSAGAIPDKDPASLSAALGRLAAWGQKTGQGRSDKRLSKASTSTKDERGQGRDLSAASSVQSSDRSPKSSTQNPGGARTATAQTHSASFDELFTRAIRELRGVDLSDSDIHTMRDALPDHLLMTFVVHDRQGRELGSGKDLGYLKRTLAGATDSALRTAVRQALTEAQERSAHRSDAKPKPESGRYSRTAPGEQKARAQRKEATASGTIDGSEGTPGSELFADDLEDFPTTPLPPSIESQAQGLTIRAFPALVPQGKPENPLAGVRVMANASQARSEHGLGVANLVLRRVQLSTKRVSTRWSGREALMLTSTPYRSSEALIADAQWASVRTLTVSLSGNQGLWTVRNRSSFDDLSQRVRDLHEDQVYSIIEVVVRAMESWAQLQDTLATADARAYCALREDAERVAHSLVFDGFIAATPIERLRNLPRYIQAQSLRVRKALRSPSDLARDEGSVQALAQVDNELNELRELMDTRPFNARHASAFEELLWMREELRVSLFAQELGTARKISPQRMLAAIDRLHEAI